MAIIDVDFVEALSGRTFDTAEADLVDTLIGYVQWELETYLSRAIEVRTFTSEQIIKSANPYGTLGNLNQNYYPYMYLYVTNPPVRSVASLSLNSNVLSSTLYSVKPWGVVYYGVGVELVNLNTPILWADPINAFEITYQGGLDGLNMPDLRMVVGRGVLKELVDVRTGDDLRAGYLSMKVEDFEWRKSEAVVGEVQRGKPTPPLAQGPFTARDLRLIDAYRRRVVASG